MLFIIIHWCLISLWGYLNYESSTSQKFTLISLLGGFLPVVTYVLWGIRRFLIKAFFIFHEKVLQYWVKDFCDSLSNKIIKKDYLSKLENFEGEVIGQFRKEIIQKVENFPPFFQKVT